MLRKVIQNRTVPLFEICTEVNNKAKRNEITSSLDITLSIKSSAQLVLLTRILRLYVNTDWLIKFLSN